MNFSFGHAKQLYARRIHPRVVLGPRDVPILRRIIRSGDGRAIMEAIRCKTRPIIERALAAADIRAVLTDPDPSWTSFRVALTWNVRDIAIVAVLDDCPDATETVRRILRGLSTIPLDEQNVGGHVYAMGVGGHPLAYDLLRDRLAPKDAAAYAAWVSRQCIPLAIRQARSAAYYRNAAANTPIALTLGALLGGLAVAGDPGARSLSADLKQLIGLFEASVNAAIRPDGYPEEDMGYGSAVAAFLGEIGEPLRRAGLFDVYAACPHYARFGNALLHFVQPWGRHLSNTGDHSDDIGWREMILARLADETRSPELLWLLGTLSYGSTSPAPGPADIPAACLEAPLRPGVQVPATGLSLLFADAFRRAVHPSRTRAPTAFRDRGRGIVSFRSSWEEDATFVVFDGSQRSPAGQGHAHASCGHFSLSALGEYFSVDTGRYSNEQSSHSLTLINGRSGRDTGGQWSSFIKHPGRLTHYAPGAFVDAAAVDSSIQHDCYWAWRHLALVKGPGAPAYVWIVDDINKADDWAAYEWQMQTSPENAIDLAPDGATVTGWRHGNRMDVHFALPAPDEYPKPHRLVGLRVDESTPSSHQYIRNPHERAKDVKRPSDMLHYAVFVRPKLVARIEGYNGRFMSVLTPRRAGDQPARVRRLKSLPASLAVRVTFPDVEDTIIFAHEHNMLEAADVSARGQWCVVRRARRTGRILAWEMGDGTRLTVAGKAVTKPAGPSLRMAKRPPAR